MTDTSIIVGVPTDDRADLEALVHALAVETELAEHRYFDGATYIEAVIPVAFSAASWATLREWIRARAEVKKSFRVTFRRGEIVGSNAKDAERIIKLLETQVNVEDGDS